jgi:hypothetical protein
MTRPIYKGKPVFAAIPAHLTVRRAAISGA